MSLIVPQLAARKPSTRRDDPNVDRWVAMLSAELESEDSGHDSGRVETAACSSVAVSLEFGTSRSDGHSAGLRPGDTLRLDQRVDEAINVVVDGRAIARGEVVVADGKIAVRIVELLVLVVAWLWLMSDHAMAFQSSRTGTTARQSDRFSPRVDDVLDTPIEPARNRRLKQATTDIMPFEPLSSVAQPEPESNSVPLTKPSGTHRLATRGGSDSGQSASRSVGGWGTTIWALFAVLVVIAVGARWLTSRATVATRGLPEEAWEVLGRESVDSRTSVLLVRCGSRMLLLSQSPAGLQALTQITDPVEIDCLAGLCRTTQRNHGLTEAFRSLLARPAPPKPDAERNPAVSSNNIPRFADRPTSLAPRPEVRS